MTSRNNCSDVDDMDAKDQTTGSEGSSEGKDEGDVNDVKSTAVVKYSVPKPALYRQLKCNTDLNRPPSNWLSNSANSFGLQQVLYQHKDFSSFRMAHLFPDCVGEVDVVSDAENIKKLLKIPYSKENISMMVHRVENTLLVDDYNIYKHLLRNAETDWKWLKEFLRENVERKVLDEAKTVYIKDKKIKALQQKSLNSKFLYHSLEQSGGEIEMDDEVNKSDGRFDRGPFLPEPTAQESTPTCDQNYNRNVVWTFEDISMLLGTDLPIFGGGTHPCISLRLREMNQPINVLTGIDYWLDNLMSNVPELLMCYHLNGIVQKYELVKTEDLPNLGNSKFSPKLIKDVAQNILSFLKSNATKAGHTYWLFKGKNDEVVKLYDLTSLCLNSTGLTSIRDDENPFTVHVAMLLYRVARNMKNDINNVVPGQAGERRLGSKTAATVRMLLKHCIRLLDEMKYAILVSSAHFMLADLYVPMNTNPNNPESMFFTDKTTEDAFDDDDDYTSSSSRYSGDPDDDLDDDIDCAPLKLLSLKSNTYRNPKTTVKKPPAPLPESVEERCLLAIEHVANGIDALQYYDPKTDDKGSSASKNAEEPKMADSSKPIPMPFETLKTDNKVEELNSSLKTVDETATWERSCVWDSHLRGLLYHTAHSVYSVLYEYYYQQERFGDCLRIMAVAVRCFIIMEKVQKAAVAESNNSIITQKVGDCLLMIKQKWHYVDKYVTQLKFSDRTHELILEQLQRDEQCYKIDLAQCGIPYVFIHDIRTIEQVLVQARKCYEAAYETSKTRQAEQRLANLFNELGRYYVDSSVMSENSQVLHNTLVKAENTLGKSLLHFDTIRDRPNMALVYLNLGRCQLKYTNVSHICTLEPTQKRTYFNKAVGCFKKALHVLGTDETEAFIRTKVHCELATTYFAIASNIYDNPEPGEGDKEVINALNTALQYCNNADGMGLRTVMGSAYYRLASIYHKSVCDKAVAESRYRAVVQLARINYERAANVLRNGDEAVNYFVVQNQRSAFLDYLHKTSTSKHIKLEFQQDCLNVLLECADMVKRIADGTIVLPEESIQAFRVDQDSLNTTDAGSLMIALKTRLLDTLKLLVKSLMTSTDTPKFSYSELLPTYKKAYALSLSSQSETTLLEFASKLYEVLTNVKKLLIPDV